MQRIGHVRRKFGSAERSAQLSGEIQQEMPVLEASGQRLRASGPGQRLDAAFTKNRTTTDAEVVATSRVRGVDGVEEHCPRSQRRDDPHLASLSGIGCPENVGILSESGADRVSSSVNQNREDEKEIECNTSVSSCPPMRHSIERELAMTPKELALKLREESRAGSLQVPTMRSCLESMEEFGGQGVAMVAAALASTRTSRPARREEAPTSDSPGIVTGRIDESAFYRDELVASIVDRVETMMANCGSRSSSSSDSGGQLPLNEQDISTLCNSFSSLKVWESRFWNVIEEYLCSRSLHEQNYENMTRGGDRLRRDDEEKLKEEAEAAEKRREQNCTNREGLHVEVSEGNLGVRRGRRSPLALFFRPQGLAVVMNAFARLEEVLLVSEETNFRQIIHSGWQLNLNSDPTALPHSFSPGRKRHHVYSKLLTRRRLMRLLEAAAVDHKGGFSHKQFSMVCNAWVKLKLSRSLFVEHLPVAQILAEICASFSATTPSSDHSAASGGVNAHQPEEDVKRFKNSTSGKNIQSFAVILNACVKLLSPEQSNSSNQSGGGVRTTFHDGNFREEAADGDGNSTGEGGRTTHSHTVLCEKILHLLETTCLRSPLVQSDPARTVTPGAARPTESGTWSSKGAGKDSRGLPRRTPSIEQEQNMTLILNAYARFQIHVRQLNRDSEPNESEFSQMDDAISKSEWAVQKLADMQGLRTKREVISQGHSPRSVARGNVHALVDGLLAPSRTALSSQSLSNTVLALARLDYLDEEVRERYLRAFNGSTRGTRELYPGSPDDDNASAGGAHEVWASKSSSPPPKVEEDEEVTTDLPDPRLANDAVGPHSSRFQFSHVQHAINFAFALTLASYKSASYGDLLASRALSDLFSMRFFRKCVRGAPIRQRSSASSVVQFIGSSQLTNQAKSQLLTSVMFLRNCGGKKFDADDECSQRLRPDSEEVGTACSADGSLNTLFQGCDTVLLRFLHEEILGTHKYRAHSSNESISAEHTSLISDVGETLRKVVQKVGDSDLQERGGMQMGGQNLGEQEQVYLGERNRTTESPSSWLVTQDIAVGPYVVDFCLVQLNSSSMWGDKNLRRPP